MYTMTFTPSNQLIFQTVMSNLSAFQAFLSTATTPSVAIDLSQISHCDSAGLAFLIEAKRLCQQDNRHLDIEGMTDSVVDLATFCGIQALWSKG